MNIINGKIELGMRDCGHCDGIKGKTPGKMAGKAICPKCKGTQRGPRGGRGTCRNCYHGKVHDFVNLVTCGSCNGTLVEPETLTDSITPEQWQALTFKVIREENGRFGFNESYLGLGYVWTCGDYGAAWDNHNDDALIANVKNDSGAHYIQACKIAKEDGTVCEYIAILVSKNGFKVKAVYAGENPTDNSKANRQVSQMFDPKQLAIAEGMI